MNPPQRQVRFWNFRSTALWLAVVTALLVCALGWRWIDFASSDAGPVDERYREITQVYLQAAYADGHERGHWADDAEFAARAWKGCWLALNGQWDTRVVAAISTVLHAASWALLLAWIAGRMREIWHYGLIAVVGMAVLLMPRAGEFWTSAATAWSGWLLLLSILQLGTQRLAWAGRWMWWVGLVVGLFNVAGAKEGVATALVLALGAVFSLSKSGARSRKAWVQLAASGGLIVLGAVLWARRGGGLSAHGSGLQAGSVHGWPHESPWAAAVLFLPAVLWLLQAARDKGGAGPSGVLFTLAGWSLFQPVVIVLARSQTGTAIWGIVGTCVLINAVFVTKLAGRASVRFAAVMVTLFAVWALAVAHSLFQVGIDRDDTEVFRENKRWRLAWMENNADALAREMRVKSSEAARFLELKKSPGLERIMPASLRNSLLSSEGAGGFRLGGMPQLEGEAEGLPVLGTWSPVEARQTGEFVSGLLTTDHRMLRLWIAGEWTGDVVTVQLRTEDGQTILPLQQPAMNAKRWIRVNFEAPGKPFRVVVTQTDPSGWVAVAGPVESGRLSWSFPKIVRLWPWLLGVGSAAGLGAFLVHAFAADRRERRVSASARCGTVARMLPWLALGVYVLVIAQGMSPSAGGADSSGYLNAARMFSEGQLTMAPREAAGVTEEEFGRAIFTPLAFKNAAEPGRIAPVTAIGVPLMYALAAFVMPLGIAVPLVILLNVVLGIVFTRMIAESFGLSRCWAWLAAGIVGLSPLYLYIGLQALSDGPSLTWGVIAVYFAWSSRTRPRHAWLAGAATAMAVLIRPSNVLCMLPVLACLPFSWKGILYWIGGGIPGGIFQAWYSWKVWGNPLTSGYGNVAEAFSLDYLPANLMHYMWWLPVLLTPVAILAPGVFFLRTVSARVRLVLMLWGGAFFGFYAFFRHTHDAWWFLRFILPAFPGLIVAALLVLRCIVNKGPAGGLSEIKRPMLAGAGVICLLVCLLLSVREFQVFFWMRSDRVFQRAGLWLKENAQPGSTVLSVHGGGTVIYYTNLPVVMYHHDFVRESPRFAQALSQGGQPVYALMFHFERPDGRPDFLGSWEEVASFNQGDARIWKWLGIEKTQVPAEPAK